MAPNFLGIPGVQVPLTCQGSVSAAHTSGKSTEKKASFPTGFLEKLPIFKFPGTQQQQYCRVIVPLLYVCLAFTTRPYLVLAVTYLRRSCVKPTEGPAKSQDVLARACLQGRSYSLYIWKGRSAPISSAPQPYASCWAPQERADIWDQHFLTGGTVCQSA